MGLHYSPLKQHLNRESGKMRPDRPISPDPTWPLSHTDNTNSTVELIKEGSPCTLANRDLKRIPCYASAAYKCRNRPAEIHKERPTGEGGRLGFGALPPKDSLTFNPTSKLSKVRQSRAPSWAAWTPTGVNCKY